MPSAIQEIDPIITTTLFGLFVLEPNDGVCQEIRDGRFWDNWLLPYFDELTREEVVIEIGASIGFHTVYMAKKCKIIHTFEPQFINYNRIIKNCELNNVENVHYYNFALYSKNCKMSINNQPNAQKDINYNNCQACSLSLRENDDGDIEAKTLDSFNIEKVSFIKVDAEGADIKILNGGKETIQKYRPKIIFESGKDTTEDRNNWAKESKYTIKEIAAANWLAIPIINK